MRGWEKTLIDSRRAQLCGMFDFNQLEQPTKLKIGKRRAQLCRMKVNL